MPVIPFREWVPDASALGNPGSVSITNAVPGVNSYKPFPSLRVSTDALTARARGAIEARDNQQTNYQYAGDASKLYVLSSGSWGDVSKSGGYSTATEERWEFVRWKNKILATNFSDDPQSIEMGGANFADMTTDFTARHIAVVRDFVVVGNTDDTTDGPRIDRIRWSAFDDETDWTVSPTTGADVRDLKTGGAIQRIIGGEFGIIISERSVWRLSFVGAPVWFQIDEVLPGIGAISPGAVANLAGAVYFMSEQGFIRLRGGSEAQFIGAGKVDKFVREDIDETYLHRMYAAADPEAGIIAWAYPGQGNSDGTPNRIVIYDATLDKWALIDLETQMIWSRSGEGTTLEGLDAESSSIDALDVSLDSSRWKGGRPLLGAFDTTNKAGFFDGLPMEATLETQERSLLDGRRARLAAFHPVIDGGTVTARVGTRNRQSDVAQFGPVLSQSASGRFTSRSNANYHRFRLTVSGDWIDAIGVEVRRQDVRPGGRRG